MMEVPERDQLVQQISNVKPENFNSLSLQLFYYQAFHNSLYAQYLKLLGVDPKLIKSVNEIPFLPIQLFKNYAIKTGEWSSKLIFSSSGTSGQLNSKHHLRHKEWYLQNARRGFEFHYGPINQYCFLALLPSYLERSDSSLVFMVEDFIKQSSFPNSGFFLDNMTALLNQLEKVKKQNIPTVLLGVSFALLDLAEQYSIDLKEIIIMETGGMKGRRKEITRKELHRILCHSFQAKNIHSEYGMTELLSQAYSKGHGKFLPAPSMRVQVREITDPFSIEKKKSTGVLNIIDLANIDTIGFIATEDLGRSYPDGSFEVLGRLDESDVRGCNLLVVNQ